MQYVQLYLYILTILINLHRIVDKSNNEQRPMTRLRVTAVTKSVQLNVSIHAKLKALSDKRREDGRHDYSMAQILSEMVLKMHSKEFK